MNIVLSSKSPVFQNTRDLASAVQKADGIIARVIELIKFIILEPFAALKDIADLIPSFKKELPMKVEELTFVQKFAKSLEGFYKKNPTIIKIATVSLIIGAAYAYRSYLNDLKPDSSEILESNDSEILESNDLDISITNENVTLQQIPEYSEEQINQNIGQTSLFTESINNSRAAITNDITYSNVVAFFNVVAVIVTLHLIEDKFFTVGNFIIDAKTCHDEIDNLNKIDNLDEADNRCDHLLNFLKAFFSKRIDGTYNLDDHPLTSLKHLFSKRIDELESVVSEITKYLTDNREKEPNEIKRRLKYFKKEESRSKKVLQRLSKFLKNIDLVPVNEGSNLIEDIQSYKRHINSFDLEFKDNLEKLKSKISTLESMLQ